MVFITISLQGQKEEERREERPTSIVRVCKLA
jgi:hypothetical protein